jgi:hypothetical protein
LTYEAFGGSIQVEDKARRVLRVGRIDPFPSLLFLRGLGDALYRDRAGGSYRKERIDDGGVQICLWHLGKELNPGVMPTCVLDPAPQTSLSVSFFCSSIASSRDRDGGQGYSKQAIHMPDWMWKALYCRRCGKHCTVVKEAQEFWTLPRFVVKRFLGPGALE